MVEKRYFILFSGRGRIQGDRADSNRLGADWLAAFTRPTISSLGCLGSIVKAFLQAASAFDEGVVRAALEAELVPIEVGLKEIAARMREAGYVRYGADGTGQHDDLVIALALAVWRARRL